MSFRAQLDAFHGPMDLLLYLVRKDELEIAELPLALLTEQFLAYVELLEQLDVDDVGEFLDIASSLIELKSRRVLPQAEETTQEPLEPQADLVERLLEYKQYRDAATQLEEQGTAWQLRRSRSVGAPPQPTVDPTEQPLEGIELWDLVSAFARIMRERLTSEAGQAEILYDDTPVHVHMQRVYDQAKASDQPITIAALFPEEQVHKSTWIGVFLSVLELVRYRHLLAEQRKRYGEVYLSVGTEPYVPIQLAKSTTEEVIAPSAD